MLSLRKVLVALLIFTCGFVVVSCTALPTTGEATKDEVASEPVAPPKTLYDTKSPELFPALQRFVNAPGTQPTRGFCELIRQADGPPAFRAVPAGWSSWDDEKSKRTGIGLNQDGFRLIVQIEAVPEIGAALIDHFGRGHRHDSIVQLDQLFAPDAVRIVRCEKYKGDTHYMEKRFFAAEPHPIRVSLNVFDFPPKRTLPEMLSFLQLHYGKYQEISNQVGSLCSEKR